jgi:pseudaminic acid synthase
LFKSAKEEGLICFSSPFDRTAVDLLEKLYSPVYKIASFEITDIPLIEYVASKGKPLIISTGIAEEADIQLAIDTCLKQNNNKIALLKCTSSYPAPINEANLIMIRDLAEKYNVISGLSDHTLGIVAPIAATVLGAKIIEKHFILNHSIGGPDASFSLDENEFAQMVKAVRAAELSVGKVDYNLTDKQKKGREFSRSLFAVQDIKIGEAFTEKNIRSIRPGYGLHPKFYKSILGKISRFNIPRGTPLNFDLVILD